MKLDIGIDAYDVAVAKLGPRKAAWLIWKHKKTLHARGYLDLHIKAGEKLPEWFQLAIDLLRARSGWSVVTFRHMGQTRFRVRWEEWPHWGLAPFAPGSSPRKAVS